jgi:hypothetical protein
MRNRRDAVEAGTSARVEPQAGGREASLLWAGMRAPGPSRTSLLGVAALALSAGVLAAGCGASSSPTTPLDVSED